MTKRQYIIIATGLLIVVFAVLLSSFLGSLKKAPEHLKPPEAKKYVKTRKVEYKQLQTNIMAYGRVQSLHALDLLSEVAGRMKEGDVKLKSGTDFKKGTLLFYIDATEQSLSLKAEKSNFLRDLAAILPDIKIDYNDEFDKWSQYFSQLDIDKPIPDLPKISSDKEKTFLATKGIYSKFYGIKGAEARLEKHYYYAPFDGSILEINLESGAFINPGVKIGKIFRSATNELKVSVNTIDVPWIRKGSVAELFSEDHKLSWKGTVNRVSDFVNQNTQSIDVFLTIHNQGSKIYDGQFMKASIPAEVIKNGLIIPRNVIYNGNEVFILQDSLLKVRQVNVLRLAENDAIVNGLDQGEDVVVEPLLNAHNNMKAYKMDSKDFNQPLEVVSKDTPQIN